MTPSNKRKFGCTEGDIDDEGVYQPQPAPPTTMESDGETAATETQLEARVIFEDRPFMDIAEELVAEAAADDEINPLAIFTPGQPTSHLLSDKACLELKNLFNFPAAGAHSPTLTSLIKLWAAGQTGLLCEAEYRDLIYEQKYSNYTLAN